MKRLKETAFSISENMMVSLGQEVQYFEELPSFLEQGKVLTLAGSRYVLVEFLPGDGYMRLFRAVRRLVQSSYLRSGMTALRRRAGQKNWPGAAHICR